MGHLLSKSKFIRGMQCYRALWLDIHRPRLARYSKEQMRRFDAGREFEHRFKSAFAEQYVSATITDVSKLLGRNVDAYPDCTNRLLATGDETVIFEAGFQYNQVLVLADVVHATVGGDVDIYEVKSGSEVTPTYINDAALQHYVISHCTRVHTFSLVVAEGGGFRIVELTKQLAAQHHRIERQLRQMLQVAAGAEPYTPMGTHCNQPYACPYSHYCQLGVIQTALNF